MKKELIGKEDINFGTTSFQRKSSAGTDIPITKVNASHLPIIDSSGRFTSTDVEGALSECQLENAVGSNTKSFTNQSGSQRVLGDVVVIDSSNDNSFTTTTVSGVTNILGVVGETIANGASGKVITGGYTSTISVDALTARGNFLKSSTSAGKATPVSDFQVGCFGIAMSGSGGPGSVSALIFGSVGGGYLPTTGGTLTGILKLSKGVDVASGSVLTLGDDGNYFDITGTSTINSIATKGVGTVVTLHFDSALTLTYHATNLILPGAVSLSVGAGDEVTLIEYTTGGWRCIGWIDASTTGTGNIVRSDNPSLNTPTLVTPKVDNINENTPTNGVTIDSLNIKDGQLNTDGCIVPTNYGAQSAGNMLVASNTPERSGTTTPDIKLKETTWNGASGSTLRITFELKSNGGNIVYGTIYRNGSSVGTLQSTTSLTYVTFTEDIAGWTKGDLIQVWCRRGASAETYFIKNLNIYTLFPTFGTANGSY